MTDYIHDVFFSYKRYSLTQDWTREVYRRLQFWLMQELGGHEPALFLDEVSIETGDRWPND